MNTTFINPLLRPEETFRTFVKNQYVVDASMHYHPIYEMNFVIKGLGVRHVGNSIEQFEEGDLILLGPNVPHCWMNQYRHQQQYSSLVVQWNEDFLSKDFGTVSEFDAIRRLLKLSRQGIKFGKYVSDEIKRKQSDLLNLPPFEKLILLLQLLNNLAKTNEYNLLGAAEASLTDPVTNSRIDRVCKYIEEKYTQKITLAQVASLVNMSEGAFSRFFSKTAQRPFFSFLNEYRVKRACKLLVETDLNAEEVGYTSGYECNQFFYRQFLKYTGYTPQAYRNKMREGQSA